MEQTITSRISYIIPEFAKRVKIKSSDDVVVKVYTNKYGFFKHNKVLDNNTFIITGKSYFEHYAVNGNNLTISPVEDSAEINIEELTK